MAELGATTVESIQSAAPAVGATDLVRKGEFDAALEALPAVPEIPDPHDPITVADSYSVALALGPGTQELSGTVRLKTSGGLLIAADGLEVDLGVGNDQAARGDHTHAAADSGVTAVQDSNSVDLTLAAGVLTAEVRLDPVPYQGVTLGESSGGLYVPTTSSGVAPFSHEHSEATSEANGFLSAADKRKLDGYGELLQLDAPTLFYQRGPIVTGDTVGGKKRWGQRMQLTAANVVAMGPVSEQRLAIEIDDTATGDTLSVPAGAGVEVESALTLTNLWVETGAYVRWRCDSGVATSSGLDGAMDLHVELNACPAITGIPEVRLNCGGGAESPYAADAYYNGGSTFSHTHEIDRSAISSPAPEEVYRCTRARWFSGSPLIYTVPGLARGIDYLVRFHFAELYFSDIGEQVMDLFVGGVRQQQGFDILNYGAKYRAVVREWGGIRADSQGQLVIEVRPQGQHCSLNGLEVIAE